MTKYELIAHMANLTFIFDHHERLGTTKNPLLVAEFVACHEKVLKILQKEMEDGLQ